MEGSLTLSRADSPEQAHTVGALFQQQGLGRVRVRGEGANSSDKLGGKVKAAERELPGPLVRLFPGV